MTVRRALLDLPTPDATAHFAARLASGLRAGDVIFLQGPIGAGKTHFARSVIQERLPAPEDIPSPTFTLVQTYDVGDVEIWHADLYRLTSVTEIEELGLLDAFETQICLVEWPDRLGDLAPHSALHLSFLDGATDDARCLELSWNVVRWDALVKDALDG